MEQASLKLDEIIVGYRDLKKNGLICKELQPLLEKFADLHGFFTRCLVVFNKLETESFCVRALGTKVVKTILADPKLVALNQNTLETLRAHYLTPEDKIFVTEFIKNSHLVATKLDQVRVILMMEIGAQGVRGHEMHWSSVFFDELFGRKKCKQKILLFVFFLLICYLLEIFNTQVGKSSEQQLCAERVVRKSGLSLTELEAEFYGYLADRANLLHPEEVRDHMILMSGAFARRFFGDSRLQRMNGITSVNQTLLLGVPCELQVITKDARYCHLSRFFHIYMTYLHSIMHLGSLLGSGSILLVRNIAEPRHFVTSGDLGMPLMKRVLRVLDLGDILVHRKNQFSHALFMAVMNPGDLEWEKDHNPFFTALPQTMADSGSTLSAKLDLAKEALELGVAAILKGNTGAFLKVVGSWNKSVGAKREVSISDCNLIWVIAFIFALDFHFSVKASPTIGNFLEARFSIDPDPSKIPAHGHLALISRRLFLTSRGKLWQVDLCSILNCVIAVLKVYLDDEVRSVRRFAADIFDHNAQENPHFVPL